MRVVLLSILLALTSATNSNELSCNSKSDCIGFVGCTAYYVRVCNLENVETCKNELAKHCSRKKTMAWDRPSEQELQEQVDCKNNICTINNIWNVRG